MQVMTIQMYKPQKLKANLTARMSSLALPFPGILACSCVHIYTKISSTPEQIKGDDAVYIITSWNAKVAWGFYFKSVKKKQTKTEQNRNRKTRHEDRF